MSRFRGNGRQTASGRNNQQENGESGNEPVYTRSHFSNGGFVNIALFENFVKTQNGERLTFGIKLHRSYKDDKGEYQTVKGFQEGDLPVLVIALSNAAAWIDMQERK